MFKKISPYLEGLLISFEPSNCVSLARVVSNCSHDSLSRILKNKAFEWQTLLQTLVLRIAGKLQGGYLVIDDTVIDKSFATIIENLSWIFCSKENRSVFGLNIVVLVWSNGTYTLPLAIKIWKKNSGKSKYDFALELLDYARNTLFLRPDYVVFDSWYASEKIIKTLSEYHWTFFTQLKKNRLFDGKQVRYRHKHPYWIEKGQIYTDIEVIVVKHGRKYFVTNDLSLSKQEIRDIYKTRWVIETMFRLLYDQIGIGQCQSFSLQAQTAHVHLCMMTVVLLEKAREMTEKTEYDFKRTCSFYPEMTKEIMETYVLEGA